MKSGNVVILLINPQRTIVCFADISIVPSFTINSTLSCFSDLNLMLLNRPFYSCLLSDLACGWQRGSKIFTCQPQTVSLTNLTSSNQKGAISETVFGWHVRILLRIPVARILWDFDFLRGLALGRLDGFSIGRYEKKRESFYLYAAKFENGAMRFWGEKSPALEPFQNKVSSLVFLL